MEQRGTNSLLRANWGLAAAALLFLFRVLFGLAFTRLLLAPLGISDYLSLQVLDSVLLITLVVLFLNWRKVSINFLLNPAHIRWSALLTNGTLAGISLFLLGNWGESWVKTNLLADLGPHPLYQLTANADRLGQFALPFIVGALLVPLAEELFYRGILYPPLLRRFGAVVGLLFSGLFFALAHFDQYWVLEVFVVGVVLSYLFHRFHSIIPGLIAHIIINGGRLIMIYLAL